MHRQVVLLGMPKLALATADERSPNPLRYEFQADVADPTEPLDAHILAFALAADKPREVVEGASVLVSQQIALLRREAAQSLKDWADLYSRKCECGIDA